MVIGRLFAVQVCCQEKEKKEVNLEVIFFFGLLGYSLEENVVAKGS